MSLKVKIIEKCFNIKSNTNKQVLCDRSFRLHKLDNKTTSVQNVTLRMPNLCYVLTTFNYAFLLLCQVVKLGNVL